MEKKNKRAVIVGIFVFLALVIFALGVMTLGGQQSLLNKGATIHAVFNEVGGLQPGNNVRYAGVKVGTVKSIAFTDDGRVKVIMNIEKESQDVIKSDVKAKVGSDGFIGNKIVVLYGGTPTAPVVKNGSRVEAERALSTEEMMETLQANNRNILAITNDFKTISQQLVNGQGSIGQLLNDEQLYRDLRSSMVSLKSASGNAQNMVANLSAYTSRLTAKGSLANDLVTDTVVFSRLRSTVRQVDALAEEAGLVVNNLQAASRELNQGLTSVTRSLNDSSSAAGLLLNDKATAADVRATIKNLEAGTKKLDENMEALQHNFLFRGFFRRRNQSQ